MAGKLTPKELFTLKWKKGLTPQQIAKAEGDAKKAVVKRAKAKADGQAKEQRAKKPAPKSTLRRPTGEGVSFKIESPHETVKELFFGAHGFNVALILAALFVAFRTAISSLVVATVVAVQSRATVTMPASVSGPSDPATGPKTSEPELFDKARVIAATEARSRQITGGKSSYLFVMIARHLSKLTDYAHESPFAARRYKSEIVNLLHPEMSSWLSAVYSMGASADYSYDFVMAELKELRAKGYDTDDALCVMEDRLKGYVEKWHQANLAFSAPAVKNAPQSEADGEGAGGGPKESSATSGKAKERSAVPTNEDEPPPIPVPPWMK